ncbi:unnamed protein product [Amoebophrya sp. A120]|nr:unnamed protein product [Amoebophrya sp. A120]|eukprot:GSA120T00013079001.1
MAATGLNDYNQEPPVPGSYMGNHAMQMCKYGLEVMRRMRGKRAVLNKNKYGKLEPMTMRFGVHSGAAVAGVIGYSNFSYDLWGDAVHTANQMESSGQVGKLHVSESTYQMIKMDFDCTRRYKSEKDPDCPEFPFPTYFVNAHKPGCGRSRRKRSTRSSRRPSVRTARGHARHDYTAISGQPQQHPPRPQKFLGKNRSTSKTPESAPAGQEERPSMAQRCISESWRLLHGGGRGSSASAPVAKAGSKPEENENLRQLHPEQTRSGRERDRLTCRNTYMNRSGLLYQEQIPNNNVVYSNNKVMPHTTTAAKS